MKKVSFSQLPENFKEDIEVFEREIAAYKNGETPDLKFKVARVARGIYEHREPGKFMLRVRIPGGGLTALQAGKIADISRKGAYKLHVTDRQDIQIHGVDLEAAPVILRELYSVNLSTKGGGGNTVRNITACSAAGVCPKERFNAAPYAVALTGFMMKDPLSHTGKLPRKYKIAFSGCGDDCAFATVNDLGFIAETRLADGRELFGFKVYAAGGLGASSRVGKLLEDFVPASEVVYYAEALKQLFNKYGNRKNKHKARLRFLMEEWGLEKFKQTLQQELDDLKAKGGLSLELPEMETGKPARSKCPTAVSSPDYKVWLDRDVSCQKQEGYCFVTVPVSLGVITGEKLDCLAELAEEYGDGSLRVDHNQNLLIRWIPESRLPDFHKKLVSDDLFIEHGGILGDIVSCPGSSTCQLGICLSRNLSSAITGEIVKHEELASLKNIRIRISGCPNSCGQHPIGQLGLFGAARRQGNRLSPYYRILAGGRTEEGKTALGEEVSHIPARNVPRLLVDFLKTYRNEAREFSAEDFYAYLDREGKEVLRSLGEKYSRLPEYAEDPSFYHDWGSNEDFSLAGRGAGECGAGVLDMIQEDLKTAKVSIKLAEAATAEPEKKGFLKEAAYAAFRSLLVTKGEEPLDYPDAASLFDKHFMKKGLADTGFRGLKEFPEVTAEAVSLVDGLVETVVDLYDKMDNNLNFTSVKKESGTTEKTAADGGLQEVFELDLGGVKCPINYVKTRLFMEEMEIGQVVKIILDNGEPIKNVPESLRNDGQEILDIQPHGDQFQVTVRKLD